MPSIAAALLLGSSLGRSGLLAAGWQLPCCCFGGRLCSGFLFQRQPCWRQPAGPPCACNQVGGNAHAQGVQLDETARIALVVGTGIILKGGDGRIEQRIGLRIATDDDHVALVQLQANRAIDGLLVIDQHLQRLAPGLHQ